MLVKVEAKETDTEHRTIHVFKISFLSCILKRSLGHGFSKYLKPVYLFIHCRCAGKRVVVKQDSVPGKISILTVGKYTRNDFKRNEYEPLYSLLDSIQSMTGSSYFTMVIPLLSEIGTDDTLMERRMMLVIYIEQLFNPHLLFDRS